MNELVRRNCKLHHGPSFDIVGAVCLGKVCVQRFSPVLLAFVWLVVTRPVFRCHLHLLFLKVTRLSTLEKKKCLSHLYSVSLESTHHVCTFLETFWLLVIANQMWGD